ncbi:cobalamin biosynthesis protein CobW [Shewanella sairae]|uniref:Cobalamin biosynthesis protein CobW n=1 Tax=Shewanella sairae TaxID=190310 RepID=A0ABQ4PBR1_9GAMM|nr:CobW family GTP-binding protein [Shewanella sairae]MCL1129930.1 CobW family GTP-binding protein [Shewanella sairae]GIU44992.1 cobalamin biosynthesis protein CobW [Shewanella sairae]
MIQKIIPTNVITGFLGVGKTSFIKMLLKHKPEGEVWAVLVNEFGEVGIDAGLLDSSEAKVQIKEVAGGCMCCAAGVPMQVAINQLIAKAKPDRLLIEPTGLGHPQEVLRVLTQPHYQQVLAMQACLTLVDARKLNDERYTQHEIFNQQLQVADVVLASKSDCYEAPMLEQLRDYLNQVRVQEATSMRNDNSLAVIPWSIEQANEKYRAMMALLSKPYKAISSNQNVGSAAGNLTKVKPSLKPLTPNAAPRLLDMNYSPLFSESQSEPVIEYDARGIFYKRNQGDGFYSYGWVFEPSYEFDFDTLLQLIKSQQVARIKAVMITEEGIAGFNGVDGELSIVELDDAMDSRIELLSMSELQAPEFETALLQAVTGLN